MTGIQVLPNFGASAPDPNDVLGALTDPVLQSGHINTANWAPPAMVRSAEGDADVFRSRHALAGRQDDLAMSGTQVPYLPLFSAPVVYAVAPDYTFTKPLTIFDLINGDWIDYLHATAPS